MVQQESRGRRLPFAFSSLDADVRREPVWLEASDTGQSFGMLYRPAGREPKTAVYLSHPRGEFSRHYVVPGLVARGYAVFGHNTRYLNNDSDMVHERLLFDIAAAMRHLREAGFERIVLLGNSGGGSLLGFYQQQASRAAGERIAMTPGGEAVPLASEVMPEGDVYIAVAAHLGEGRFMLNVIDPAVIDEREPTLSDPAWDMYNPANGYRPFPEPSRYDGGVAGGVSRAATGAEPAAGRGGARTHRGAAAGAGDDAGGGVRIDAGRAARDDHAAGMAVAVHVDLSHAGEPGVPGPEH